MLFVLPFNFPTHGRQHGGERPRHQGRQLQRPVDDGWLDLWLFGGRSFPETLQRAWTLFTGRHVSDPNIQRIGFHKLTLQANSPAGIQLDGEPRQGRFPVEIEVWPRALNVLVPAEAPRTLFVDGVGEALHEA